MSPDRIAYPEWTEYRNRSGLDPLGMQNSSINLYQRLVPGISNVTLRMRYYGLYAWLAAVYARDSGRSTDPENWKKFVRRAEALYALAAVHGEDSAGVAGSRWAGRKLAASGGRISFAEDADPDGSGLPYLKQAWGAFGAAYGSQLFDPDPFLRIGSSRMAVSSSGISSWMKVVQGKVCTVQPGSFFTLS